jgi:1-aminocyclopropane-1-carboxylate deaminase/D-cysteine desulfhydrase-like pyridoxal-dependent ACC family enzyme
MRCRRHRDAIAAQVARLPVLIRVMALSLIQYTLGRAWLGQPDRRRLARECPMSQAAVSVYKEECLCSQDFAAIRTRIAQLPRVRIALIPTPLEDAPHLSRALGGPQILVKRDDLTGPAFGGNKVRNLEFRLAHALKERPDTVIVGLDIQSNSARQTVAACNKLGLRTILVLEGKRPEIVQGNLLVDYLLGAEVHFAATREEQRQLLDSLAESCRAEGGTPHILNDNPMFDVASAVAYLEATLELLEQLGQRHMSAVYLSSSGKGQAGLVLARRLTNKGFAVHGISATDEFDVPMRTAAIANAAAEALGLELVVTPEEIENDTRFVGASYGIPTDASNEAVKLFARCEGIVLDPIYSGKAAAGMIAHIREGRFRRDDTLVFVHTGGSPAIFTWEQLWL